MSIVFRFVCLYLKELTFIVDHQHIIIHQGSVVFHITGTNESYSLDLKSASPSVTKGEMNGADLHITVSEADMVKLAHKELKPQEAFMKGKLKIKGKMALAMKLNSVLAVSRKYLPKPRL